MNFIGLYLNILVWHIPHVKILALSLPQPAIGAKVVDALLPFGIGNGLVISRSTSYPSNHLFLVLVMGIGNPLEMLLEPDP